MLKACRGVDEEEVVRFRHEAFLMSKLGHPNIALVMGMVMMPATSSDEGEGEGGNNGTEA